MTSNKIRQPQQKRAIQKKQKIIQASYQLFSQNGYYNTNTAQIAKQANVSTGILYSYFNDKKDILIEVIKLYLSDLSQQFSPLLNQSIHANHIPHILDQIIEITIASHTMQNNAHNEFLALSLLEPDIHTLFEDFESNLLAQLHLQLIKTGIPANNLTLKLKISYGIIEQIVHHHIQNPQSKQSLAETKTLAIQTIQTLLNNPN
jgi:AcrR family transcriptional regulator